MRFIILGDAKTGKTTFFNKLQANYTDMVLPTIGIDVITYTHTHDNTNTKIIIWDTSGDIKYRAIISSYMRNNCGFLLFIDLSVSHALDNLEEWLKTIAFFNACQHEHPIVLIGNKKDLPIQVDADKLANIIVQYKLIYITTSCTTNCDMDAIMDTIISEVKIRFIAKHISCPGIQPANTSRNILRCKTDDEVNKCY